MASSGLEDLDRAVVARRRARRSGLDEAAPESAQDRAPSHKPSATPPPIDDVDSDEGSGAVRTRSRRTPRTVQPGRIRTLGTIGGLAAPAVAAAVGALVWVIAPPNGVSGAVPSLIAYLLALLAMPTLLATGLPFYGEGWRIVAAVVSSGLLWLALGRWAAGRATRDIDAGWRDYAAELGTMTVAVWGGVLVGLVAMAVILSR